MPKRTSPGRIKLNRVLRRFSKYFERPYHVTNTDNPIDFPKRSTILVQEAIPPPSQTETSNGKIQSGGATSPDSKTQEGA